MANLGDTPSTTNLSAKEKAMAKQAVAGAKKGWNPEVLWKYRAAAWGDDAANAMAGLDVVKQGMGPANPSQNKAKTKTGI